MATTQDIEIDVHGGTRPLGRIDSAFKRAVHASLESIRGGSLVLSDAEGIVELGARRGPQGVQATVRVHDPAFYAAAATRGLLGAAEAYIDGLWDCDDLTALVRLMARNANTSKRLNGGLARLLKPMLRLFAHRRRNTRRGSRANIAAHYDLGNDFFELFLDPTMTYSSAVFDDPAATLEQAQRAKYDRICRKLELTAADHVVEVGTGWGGFAIHAASTYGCRVTTTTISERQHALATERIAQAGLGDRVELLLSDYRDLTGCYDKLVSIEMIEAVGHEFMEDYFRTCCRLLTVDGTAVIQAIVNPDQMHEESKTSVEFIKRYIFPGGSLPSVWSMCDAAKNATDFRMTHLEDITAHYARTLAIWRAQMDENLDRIRALGYDESFLRMWRFYLCYCEGAFEERVVGAVQVAFERSLARREPVLGQLAPAAHARAA